jgi:hypothetical protein
MKHFRKVIYQIIKLKIYILKKLEINVFKILLEVKVFKIHGKLLQQIDVLNKSIFFIYFYYFSYFLFLFLKINKFL